MLCSRSASTIRSERHENARVWPDRRAWTRAWALETSGRVPGCDARVVKLTSRDGAEVLLVPTRYQFERPASAGDGRDWDANWLVVHGEVTTADARRWCFDDPCLTTWEAASLTTWLEGVAAGVVEPVAEDDLEEATGSIEVYTEPNLALSLAGLADERACIRVHFSLESCPPWLPEPERTDLFSYFVALDLSINDIRHAIDEWEQERLRLPER